MNYRTIFWLTMRAAKNRITKDKGKDFYAALYKRTAEILDEIAPLVPDIKGSLFYFNYQFGVCYAAWFKALLRLGYDESSAVQETWNLTEDFLRLIPQPIMRIAAKPYLNHWRKRAPEFEAKGKNGKLHPFDYRIRYVPVDDNTFELDFHECAMKKLFAKLGVQGLMPPARLQVSIHEKAVKIRNGNSGRPHVIFDNL